MATMSDVGAGGGGAGMDMGSLFWQTKRSNWEQLVKSEEVQDEIK